MSDSLITPQNSPQHQLRQPTAAQEASALPQPIQLFQEQLITDKRRIKTGEIKISKQIVTETSQADIPVTKEKIVIEIESIYSGHTSIAVGDAEVDAQGVMHMDIYEEQAMVCRQVIPHQQVSVRKEVVQKTIHVEEPVRREEIAVEVEGDPEVRWE